MESSATDLSSFLDPEEIRARARASVARPVIPRLKPWQKNVAYGLPMTEEDYAMYRREKGIADENEKEKENVPVQQPSPGERPKSPVLLSQPRSENASESRIDLSPGANSFFRSTSTVPTTSSQRFVAGRDESHARSMRVASQEASTSVLTLSVGAEEFFKSMTPNTTCTQETNRSVVDASQRHRPISQASSSSEGILLSPGADDFFRNSSIRTNTSTTVVSQNPASAVQSQSSQASSNAWISLSPGASEFFRSSSIPESSFGEVAGAEEEEGEEENGPDPASQASEGISLSRGADAFFQNVSSFLRVGNETGVSVFPAQSPNGGADALDHSKTPMALELDQIGAEDENDAENDEEDQNATFTVEKIPEADATTSEPMEVDVNTPVRPESSIHRPTAPTPPRTPQTRPAKARITQFRLNIPGIEPEPGQLATAVDRRKLTPKSISRSAVQADATTGQLTGEGSPCLTGTTMTEPTETFAALRQRRMSRTDAFLERISRPTIATSQRAVNGVSSGQIQPNRRRCDPPVESPHRIQLNKKERVPSRNRNRVSTSFVFNDSLIQGLPPRKSGASSASVSFSQSANSSKRSHPLTPQTLPRANLQNQLRKTLLVEYPDTPDTPPRVPAKQAPRVVATPEFPTASRKSPVSPPENPPTNGRQIVSFGNQNPSFLGPSSPILIPPVPEDVNGPNSGSRDPPSPILAPPSSPPNNNSRSSRTSDVAAELQSMVISDDHRDAGAARDILYGLNPADFTFRGPTIPGVFADPLSDEEEEEVESEPQLNVRFDDNDENDDRIDTPSPVSSDEIIGLNEDASVCLDGTQPLIKGFRMVKKEKTRFFLAKPKLIMPSSPNNETAKLRRSKRTRCPRLAVTQRPIYKRDKNGLYHLEGIADREITDPLFVKYGTNSMAKIVEIQNAHRKQRRIQKDLKKKYLSTHREEEEDEEEEDDFVDEDYRDDGQPGPSNRIRGYTRGRR